MFNNLDFNFLSITFYISRFIKNGVDGGLVFTSGDNFDIFFFNISKNYGECNSTIDAFFCATSTISSFVSTGYSCNTSSDGVSEVVTSCFSNFFKIMSFTTTRLRAYPILVCCLFARYRISLGCCFKISRNLTDSRKQELSL